jgi:hypothetical protein
MRYSNYQISNNKQQKY